MNKKFLNNEVQQKQPVTSSNKAWGRQHKIIELLRNSDTSREELKHQLNVCDRTLRYDLAALRNNGFDIPDHKNNILSLINKDSSFFEYEPITTETIHDWTILCIINMRDSPKFAEIKEYFDTFTPAENMICEDLIRASINRLIHGSFISRKGYCYSSNFPSTFITLDYIHALDLDFFCSNNAINLKSLRNKINLYWPFWHSRSKENYLLSDINKYLNIFLKYNFKEKALSFEYISSNNIRSTVPHFYTGKIIYSREKDTLYILGKDRPKKSSYSLYRMEKIILDSITETAETNYCYDNLEFNTITTEMFDVALDKHNVQVKFTFLPSIHKKVRELSKGRLNSKITYISNKDLVYSNLTDIPDDEEATFLMYEDVIRGLGGFANYLRQFGDNAIVLNDKKLIMQMKDETVVRALKKYREKERDDYER